MTKSSNEDHLKGSSKSPSFWFGLDGTRNGWSVCVLDKDGKVTLYLISKLDDIWLLPESENVRSIAIDMPLALADKAERGGRGCEREARRLLTKAKQNAKSSSSSNSQIPFVGPASIFTPPCRPALEAFAKGASHSEVSEINRNSALNEDRPIKRQKKDEQLEIPSPSLAGLGLSIQAFNIMPKILELDQFVSTGIRKDSFFFHPSDRAAKFNSNKILLFECHPELAFLSLSASKKKSSLESLKALKTKKSLIGRKERLKLINSSHLIDNESLIRANGLVKVDLSLQTSWSICHITQSDGKEQYVTVPSDDVIDSIVCAMIAKRFEREDAISIGETIDEAYEKDSRNVPMTIFV